MSEAPERIWAQKEAFSDDWDAGTFCTVSDGGVGYMRADHVDALLKAEREKALREAAEKVEDLYCEYSEGVPYCDRDEAVAVIEAALAAQVEKRK